ncbi:hypothetical protein DPMN_091038 [Dreissena polymorpha]|uniref:Uncharacterized protein n=1 Tax=Dreissena polymorpha TaxID=45954 RepID=A0A9D4KZQ9_DREPO|nr:hypothetical protein DPMN_091038 [Dreissena polymorpha]
MFSDDEKVPDTSTSCFLSDQYDSMIEDPSFTNLEGIPSNPRERERERERERYIYTFAECAINSRQIDPDDFGRETPFLEEEELGLVEITAVKARLGYGKMMNEELMNGIGAMATMSETGCSNRDVFKEYMDTHFRYEPIGVPLDVVVFGPFKRYYYSDCAAYIQANMGKV